MQEKRTTQNGWYRFKKEFEEMPRDEKRRLRIEFEKLRTSAYQNALKGEAQRLNCAPSEVKSTSLVLPVEPEDDRRILLASLPKDIFVKIMHCLDSLDIFRMTLVCKKWKSLVYDNCAELKRAEHALTTHLITFTKWMDPPKTPSCKTFLRQYCHFSWGLMKWCCGISNNLETLILDYPVSYLSLAALLKSCPNLGNLQLGRNSARLDFDHSVILPEEVHLPKLEVYLCSKKHSDDQSKQLRQDILCSVEQLRVLRASIEDKDVEDIQLVRPVTVVFGNLTALDLTRFTDNILLMLASIPNLKLKYLRLRRHDSGTSLVHGVFSIVRSRDALHFLLSKLPTLEMLTISEDVGVTNDTIQLLTYMEVNLTNSTLYRSFYPSEFAPNEEGILAEIDPLRPDVLLDFRNMLLSKNPSIDLAQIRFVLHRGVTLYTLQEMNLGFTSLEMHGFYFQSIPSSGLNDPKIQRRLGINL